MPSSRRLTPPVLLLGAASGLSPFGVTIIVPLLAVIGARFDAGFGEVQFLVSAYLFGLATAQPFNGFLCDRFGRRPVLPDRLFRFCPDQYRIGLYPTPGRDDIPAVPAGLRSQCRYRSQPRCSSRYTRRHRGFGHPVMDRSRHGVCAHTGTHHRWLAGRGRRLPGIVSGIRPGLG